MVAADTHTMPEAIGEAYSTFPTPVSAGMQQLKAETRQFMPETNPPPPPYQHTAQGTATHVPTTRGATATTATTTEAHNLLGAPEGAEVETLKKQLQQALTDEGDIEFCEVEQLLSTAQTTVKRLADEGKEGTSKHIKRQATVDALSRIQHIHAQIQTLEKELRSKTKDTASSEALAQLKASLQQALTDEDDIEFCEVEQLLSIAQTTVKRLADEGEEGSSRYVKRQAKVDALSRIQHIHAQIQTLEKELRSKTKDTASSEALAQLKASLQQALTDEDDIEFCEVEQLLSIAQTTVKRLADEGEEGSSRYVKRQAKVKAYANILQIQDSINRMTGRGGTDTPSKTGGSGVVVLDLINSNHDTPLQQRRSSSPLPDLPFDMDEDENEDDFNSLNSQGVRPTREGSAAEREAIGAERRRQFEKDGCMPESCEKSLVILSHYVAGLDEGEAPLLTFEELRLRCELFDAQSKHLEADVQGAVVVSVDGLLALGQEETEIDIEHMRDDVEKALTAVRPLDLDLIATLTSRTKTASESIAGKDIVLLLGGTGAGKSTTIHFLAGSNMVAKEVNGMPHIAGEIRPSSDAQFANDLRQITASPFMRSETRSISSVAIPCSGAGSHEDSILLCDTPGFEDTDGPELDIANGLGVIAAVRRCRSVRPVVLVGKLDEGMRGQGVGKFISTLDKLMVDAEHNARHCTYLFTKYGKEECKSLGRKLKNIRSQWAGGAQKHKHNRGELALLEDMRGKIKAEVIVAPLKDDRQTLLKLILDAPCIEAPKDVFREFVSDASMMVLQEQLRRDSATVMQAAESLDVSMLKYKCGQLKAIASNLQQKDCETAYETCVRQLETFVAKEMRRAVVLLSGQLDPATPPNESELKEGLHLFGALATLDPVLDEHHCHNEADAYAKPSVQCATKCLHFVGIFSSGLKNELASETMQDRDSIFCQRELPHQLEKLQIVVGTLEAAKGFLMPEETGMVRMVYQDICQQISDVLLAGLDRNAKCDIDDPQAERFVLAMDVTAHVLKEWPQHINTDVATRYTQCASVFVEQCAELVNMQIAKLQAQIIEPSKQTQHKAAAPQGALAGCANYLAFSPFLCEQSFMPSGCSAPRRVVCVCRQVHACSQVRMRIRNSG